MFDFGQSVVDFIFMAHPIEDMHKGVFVLLAVSKLDAVISKDSVDFIGNGYNEFA